MSIFLYILYKKNKEGIFLKVNVYVYNCLKICMLVKFGNPSKRKNLPCFLQIFLLLLTHKNKYIKLLFYDWMFKVMRKKLASYVYRNICWKYKYNMVLTCWKAVARVYVFGANDFLITYLPDVHNVFNGDMSLQKKNANCIQILNYYKSTKMS